MDVSSLRRLVFFSRGVVDTVNAAGETFGPGRLLPCADPARYPDRADALATIIETIDAWAGPAGTPADRTVILLDREERT